MTTSVSTTSLGLAASPVTAGDLTIGLAHTDNFALATANSPAARTSARLTARREAAVCAALDHEATPGAARRPAATSKVTKATKKKPAPRKTAILKKASVATAHKTTAAAATIKKRVRAPAAPAAPTDASGRARRAVKIIERYGTWGQ
ncbi:hypothetical protein EDC01DRAFT_776395 [Geopyxis carbonaria]|nr:hypothetical protein EDC01DRAFT_776395 [Geopyxis carbonaria]